MFPFLWVCGTHTRYHSILKSSQISQVPIPGNPRHPSNVKKTSEFLGCWPQGATQCRVHFAVHSLVKAMVPEDKRTFLRDGGTLPSKQPFVMKNVRKPWAGQENHTCCGCIMLYYVPVFQWCSQPFETIWVWVKIWTNKKTDGLICNPR